MLTKFIKSPDVAATLFSSGTYKAFAKRNWRTRFFNTLKEAKILRRNLRGYFVRDVYEAAYTALVAGYRCEYVYKNTLARKILLERHSFSEATLLGEFYAAGAKVDLAIVNGTSTAYEIKTAYDKLDRLPSQIDSYSKVFDEIYVVTDISTIESVEKIIPTHVGILELTQDTNIRTHKRALSNRNEVSSSSIFWSLRESEYKKIVYENLRVTLDLPNTERVAAYHKLFSSIDPQLAHQGMVSALRDRMLPSAQLELVNASPWSLKYLSLSKTLPNKDMTNIRLALDEVL